MSTLLTNVEEAALLTLRLKVKIKDQARLNSNGVETHTPDE